jgi:hypothetical protein
MQTANIRFEIISLLSAGDKEAALKTLDNAVSLNPKLK